MAWKVDEKNIQRSIHLTDDRKDQHYQRSSQKVYRSV